MAEGGVNGGIFRGKKSQEGGKVLNVDNKGDSKKIGGNLEAHTIQKQDFKKMESPSEDLLSKEVACKLFRIQSKKYYIDVMENNRGRFIKVVETSADGRKNKMNLSLATAAKLTNELKSFAEFYASLGPQKEEKVIGDGVLKKAFIVEKNKRYFIDFKTNGRVRYLVVKQAVWGGARSHIMIPALGIVEWRNNLKYLLEEFGPSEEELPEGSCLKVRNNKFYFDIERGQSGVFMRISAVGKSFRRSITVPTDVWEQFTDIIDDYRLEMEEASQDDENEEESTQDSDENEEEITQDSDEKEEEATQDSDNNEEGATQDINQND